MKPELMELPLLSTRRQDGHSKLTLEDPRLSREEILERLLPNLLLLVGPGVLLYAGFFLISGPVYDRDGKAINPLWSWLFIFRIRVFLVGVACPFFWCVFTSFTRRRFVFNADAGALEVQRLLAGWQLWRRCFPLSRLKRIVVGITSRKYGSLFTVEIHSDWRSLVLWTCQDLKDAERVADRVSKFTGLPFTNKTQSSP